MRYFLHKPILGSIILAWVIISCAVLWSPRESIRHAGSEIRKVAKVVVPSKTPQQLHIFDGDNWHIFLFIGIAVLVTCYPHRLRWNEILALLFLLNVFSLVTEIVQEILVPGRSFQWYDILLNQAGIVLGIGFASISRCYIIPHLRKQSFNR